MNVAVRADDQAQDVAQRAAADEQIVVFNLSDELFGIDIARVQEIIRWQRITAVPKAPYYVEGIINLRGRIVPVVDLRRCFSMESAPLSKETRIVVVDIRGVTVGLVLDGVSEVLDVPASAIEAPSPVITTTDSAFLRGIARLSDRLITLLDLEQVITIDTVAAIGTM